ncbi:phytase [Parasphingorhabdus sp.]|uniref:phytase n=1 Tax=Parasphingorhabdus sp. TaxID=2709688 RepID=UPI003A904AAA
MKARYILFAASALGLAGCSANTGMNSAATTAAVPTLELAATGETVPVGTVARDAADDPAIWRNPDDPAKSLVIGTDKRAGLYVFGMDGSKKSFLPEGELNNVDLREVMIDGRKTVLVGASIRNDLNNAHIGLYRLEADSAELNLLGKFPAGAGEAYGFCFGRDSGDEVFAYMITKAGNVRELKLSFAMGVPNATIMREHKLTTQPEGCVVDDRTGRLYVGEENAAIWMYDLNADAFVPHRFADVNGRELVADVEGLALAPKGKNGGYLVASSQGDNAYVLYDLLTGAYVNRFRLIDGAVDGTSETDGIEVILGDFGPQYPDGLMVVQDGDNGNRTQNFKYVSWRKVLEALEGSE